MTPVAFMEKWKLLVPRGLETPFEHEFREMVTQYMAERKDLKARRTLAQRLREDRAAKE